jgi:hypothetical protein
MSTLLINGCSFARCWNPSEEFLKSLSCDQVINLGKDGGSLQRVVRTTVEWIAQNGPPYIVIIPIPLASRWELSIAKNEDAIDGSWYPMQVKEYLDEKKISTLVDFKKLQNLTDLYHESIPDIRTYWDSCFTDLILLSAFLEQNKIEYLIFDMCNQFDKKHLKDFYGKKDYKGFEKIKLIEKNKKIIDLFKFCGNHYMCQSMNEENKKNIDPLMYHHYSNEYQKLESYLQNYLWLQQ